jgi:hypothetical protein
MHMHVLANAKSCFYRIMAENEDDVHLQDQGDQVVMATSAVLSAASHLLFASCREHFDSFMRCRSTPDPQRTATPAERCADLAQACIKCSHDAFQLVAQSSPCRDLFRKFWRCLDNNDLNRIYCRAEERVFYECSRDQLVQFLCARVRAWW